MDINETPISETLPLFGGRQPLFNWLKQNLLESTNQQALAIIGRLGMGKSAFLKQFERQDDRVLIRVYIQLTENALDLDVLIQTLLKTTIHTLDTQGFGLGRLPETPDTKLANWFDEQFLPELFRIIRPHRRLVWLFDDAECLIDKETSESIIPYLHQLLKKHKQLRMVLAINTAYEDQVEGFGEFIDVQQVQRLRRLTENESADLLHRISQHPIENSMVQTICRLTGGFPQLLQAYTEKIIASDVPISSDDLKEITQQIYTTHQEQFRSQWQELEQDERLVLTAMSSLLYQNPQHNVNPADIETWLVETDYPLPLNNIHAALRSLDYRELVFSSSEGIQFTNGLMQQWLLQHARLDSTAFNKQIAEGQADWRMISIGIIAVIIVIVLLTTNLNSNGNNPQSVPPQPTVTFEQVN